MKSLVHLRADNPFRSAANQKKCPARNDSQSVLASGQKTITSTVEEFPRGTSTGTAPFKGTCFYTEIAAVVLDTRRPLDIELSGMPKEPTG